PLPLIERWGADSIRTTMLFSGPVEDDVDWATVSAAGAHKWLGRVYRAVFEASERSAEPGSGSAGEPLRRLVHRTRKGVTAEVVLVVQVDGKVRDRLPVPSDADEDACRELALASERVRVALDGREIERVVVRAPKLVNLVTSSH